MRQRLEIEKQTQAQVPVDVNGDERGGYAMAAAANLSDESDMHHVRFKMVTDARSRKVKESEYCEVCWWFHKTSEQYRVSGKLRFVGESDEDEKLVRQRHGEWKKLRDTAKDQFYWDHPGAVFSGVVDSENNHDDDIAAKDDANGSDDHAHTTTAASVAATTPDDHVDGDTPPPASDPREHPPSNFLLMLLDPDRIDHLCLKTDVRIIDERIGEAACVSATSEKSDEVNAFRWKAYRVNP